MKKLLAIVIMVALLCSSFVCASGDTSRTEAAETIKKYSVETLKALESMYEIDPDKCGDEFIMMTHAYYELYQTISLVGMAEMDWDLTMNPLSGGKSPAAEQSKQLSNGLIVLSEMALGRWKQWTGGEISNEEYLEFLMKLVKVTTSREE